MRFKKIEWGDIPHITYVKDNDIIGKWIECDISNVKICINSHRYKRKDSVNDSLYIVCKFGIWSIHLI